MDSLDCYVFKNWMHGEIVEGPRVSRHWIGISLLFPRNRIPDPRFARRLMKHGVKVSFNKVARAEAEEEMPTEHQGDDAAIKERQSVDEDGEDKGCWMARLDFPRRFINQMNAAALDAYDDEVDTDDVQAAQDSGLNDESAYKAPPGSEPNPELAANADQEGTGDDTRSI